MAGNFQQRLDRSQIHFIRKNGRVIPIKGKDPKEGMAGAGRGGGSGVKGLKPKSAKGSRGGEGSRVYRDGASKASMREADTEKRIFKKSGAAKFAYAGTASAVAGALLLDRHKKLGLAALGAGAGLIAVAQRKINYTKKNEYRKPKSSSGASVKSK